MSACLHTDLHLSYHHTVHSVCVDMVRINVSVHLIDIDECLDDNGGCQQICTNLIGSHECSCELGYTLQQDKIRCVGECTWYQLWVMLTVIIIPTPIATSSRSMQYHLDGPGVR